jgi:hypothetical protein
MWFIPHRGRWILCKVWLVIFEIEISIDRTFV